MGFVCSLACSSFKVSSSKRYNLGDAFSNKHTKTKRTKQQSKFVMPQFHWSLYCTIQYCNTNTGVKLKQKHNKVMEVFIQIHGNIWTEQKTGTFFCAEHKLWVFTMVTTLNSNCRKRTKFIKTNEGKKKKKQDCIWISEDPNTKMN